MPKRITLQSMLEAYENDRLSKADFLESVEMLVKKLDERMGRDKGELDTSLTFMAGKFNELRSQIEEAANGREERLSASEKALFSQLEARLAALESMTKARLAELSDGRQGEQGIQGIPGRDGSPDMAEDIRNKLELLEGEERLSIGAIKNLAEELDTLRKLIKAESKFVVGGGGSMRVQQTILDAAETPNGVITAFTFVQKPLMVVVNGSNYRENKGWTWSGTQATLDFAPATGSDVYAIL